MIPLQHDLLFKPIEKQKLTRNMLFLDDLIVAGFSGNGKDEKIVRFLKLNNGNTSHGFKLKWDILFTGNYNNPCIKSNRLFFESYSGLWYKKPPAINYFNIDSLTDKHYCASSGITPEIFTKGRILRVFGLPDTMIAIKDQDKFLQPASPFPIRIVSSDDPQKVYMDFSSNTHSFRPQTNDFISPDLSCLCRFVDEYIESGKGAAFVKYDMKNGKPIAHIAMTEFVKTFDGLSYNSRFRYGYSVHQSVPRMFFWQDNSLSIVNLNSFQKTSLMIPYCPVETLGTNTELDFHPIKPWIYLAANDGSSQVFNYLSHRFEDISCPEFDNHYGLLFSPDGRWLVYVNKDSGKLLVEHFRDS